MGRQEQLDPDLMGREVAGEAPRPLAGRRLLRELEIDGAGAAEVLEPTVPR
jgi:hypothetical protein